MMGSARFSLYFCPKTLPARLLVTWKRYDDVNHSAWSRLIHFIITLSKLAAARRIIPAQPQRREQSSSRDTYAMPHLKALFSGMEREREHTAICLCLSLCLCLCVCDCPCDHLYHWRPKRVGENAEKHDH